MKVILAIIVVMQVYDQEGRCEGHVLIVRAVTAEGSNKQFGHRAISNIIQIE